MAIDHPREYAKISLANGWAYARSYNAQALPGSSLRTGSMTVRASTVPAPSGPLHIGPRHVIACHVNSVSDLVSRAWCRITFDQSELSSLNSPPTASPEVRPGRHHWVNRPPISWG